MQTAGPGSESRLSTDTKPLPWCNGRDQIRKTRRHLTSGCSNAPQRTQDPRAKRTASTLIRWQQANAPTRRTHPTRRGERSNNGLVCCIEDVRLAWVELRILSPCEQKSRKPRVERMPVAGESGTPTLPEPPHGAGKRATRRKSRRRTSGLVNVPTIPSRRKNGEIAALSIRSIGSASTRRPTSEPRLFDDGLTPTR